MSEEDSKYESKISKKPIAWIAVGVLIASFIVTIVILWWQDAPPIPDDYTIEDLYSADPKYNESYDILLSFADDDPNDKDAPAIGLTAENVNIISELTRQIKDSNSCEKSQIICDNADKIEEIWTKAQLGREKIAALAAFDQIADLSEPDINSSCHFFSNYRTMLRLYDLYVRLEFEKGDQKKAIEAINEFHSVIEKLNLTARSLVTKLVCIASEAELILTANYIANHREALDETILGLTQTFSPLTDKQLSYRDVMLFEYLVFKNALTDIRKGMKSAPALKYNSSVRLYRNYLIDVVNDLEPNKETKEPDLPVWPIALSGFRQVKLTSGVQLPKSYKIYNPVGSMLISILLPAYEETLRLRIRLGIQDDLLQIVLNKRLGRDYSLKARAYSDEYIIDIEKEIICSPGLDGQSYTDDDIKLKINPEVLGFE